MKTETLLSRLLSSVVFAVVRTAETKKVDQIVEAISRGGVKNIEITMTVPNAIDAIRTVAKSSSSDIIVGAGTVTEKRVVKELANAGAKFIVSPIWDIEILNECQRQNIICVPAGYTPTEIFQAWKAGAELIKIFPATTLGPRFIKDIAGPFPEIKLMPTGGVTVENVGEWIKAGAAAVGIGGDLIDKEAIKANKFDLLTDKALKLVQNIQKVKNEIDTSKIKKIS
jgi:2-dehydro-3-deoxyphosphogluconate aldolase / (4S)-4-hydroxy-2-oxoglutarate aldolase